MHEQGILSSSLCNLDRSTFQWQSGVKIRKGGKKKGKEGEERRTAPLSILHRHELSFRGKGRRGRKEKKGKGNSIKGQVFYLVQFNTLAVDFDTGKRKKKRKKKEGQVTGGTSFYLSIEGSRRKRR